MGSYDEVFRRSIEEPAAFGRRRQRPLTGIKNVTGSWMTRIRPFTAGSLTVSSTPVLTPWIAMSAMAAATRTP